MPVLFVYILKLSISLAVVYLFYRLVLRKLTFYACNRWYLVGYSLLSFFIAFFNITPLFQGGLQQYSRAIQFVPVIDLQGQHIPTGKNTAEAAIGWNSWSMFLLVLLAGAVVLLVRLAIQYFSFLSIRKK